MSIDPKLPDEYSKIHLKYRFFLNHYWDHIDVKDNRIVHSPVYHNKLNHFLENDSAASGYHMSLCPSVN